MDKMWKEIAEILGATDWEEVPVEAMEDDTMEVEVYYG